MTISAGKKKNKKSAYGYTLGPVIHSAKSGQYTLVDKKKGGSSFTVESRGGKFELLAPRSGEMHARGDRRLAAALVVGLRFNRTTLIVQLSDGREVSAPLEWFPKLRDATPAQRADWRLVGRGVGIHWHGLDEDLSVEGLLAR